MSERSLTFKIVKYLLIAKICVIIVVSFLLLIAFIAIASHNTTDGKHTPEEEVLYYYHTESSTLDHSMIWILSTIIALEIVIQILGLVGVIRGNVILLLIFGILVSLGAFYEFVAIFTYDGNALALIYFTFLSVLVFVYIFLIRSERQHLPRVHYIPAPTNPYSYSHFPQPNSQLYKENSDV